MALDVLLVRYGAVISGSVALQYFLPETKWTAHDLDIYVPESTFDDFVSAVVDQRGLRFTALPLVGAADGSRSEPGSNDE